MFDSYEEDIVKTVIALEELQERYAFHRLTSKQALSKLKVIMERFNQQHFDNYWQEFSKSYSDEDCFTENNFNCAFYCDILTLLENSKEEAKKHGVDVKYIMKLYEESKMPEEEQKEDPKEASERAWYEVDKRALEDIVYYKRKCLDEYYIRQRIIDYEKKQKEKEQKKNEQKEEKAKFNSIFNNVKELFL